MFSLGKAPDFCVILPLLRSQFAISDNVQCSGQTEWAQGGSELLEGAEAHAAVDAHLFAVATVFDALAVDQSLGHRPHGFAGGGIGEPTSKVA